MIIYFIIIIFILIVIIYFININSFFITKSNVSPSIPPIINNNPLINNNPSIINYNPSLINYKLNMNTAINKLSLINNPNLRFNNEMVIALQEIKTFSSNSESLLNSFIKSLDNNNNNDLSLNSKNKLLLFLKSLIPFNIPSNIRLNIPSNVFEPFNNNYNYYDIILNYIINLEKDIENTILLQKIINIVPSNIARLNIIPSNIARSNIARLNIIPSNIIPSIIVSSDIVPSDIVPSNIVNTLSPSLNIIPSIVPDIVPSIVPSIVPDIVPAIVPTIIPAIVLDIVPAIVPAVNYAVKYFIYTGSIQTFDIPLGVKFINIYCWGAGGGSGYDFINNRSGGYGGNGGFVSATLNVTSMSSLSIIVGQGGKKGIRAVSSSSSFGGGGAGHGNDSNWACGGGGGLSGIFVNNENMNINNYIINSNAIPILIAGGGGSGGCSNTNLHGGNAGGLTGNNASSTSISISYGFGGTQTNGGSSANILFPPNTNAGNKFMGGIARDYGGGGGGGFYGGGGGKYTTGNVSGGGGGSSYINTTNFTLSNIIMPTPSANGTRNVPGYQNKYYTSNVGLGAEFGLNNGKNGLIVIEYISNGEILSEIPSKKLTPYPPLINPDYNNFYDSTNENVIFINDVIDENNNITTVESVYNIVVSGWYWHNAQSAFALIDNNKNTFWQTVPNIYFLHYTGDKFLGGPRNLSDNGHKGEWFYIKLPKQINLVQYSLGYAGQGPSLWRIYGSNDGTNWTEIRQASPNIPINGSSFINNNYTFELESPSPLYQYFGCVITHLYAGVGNYAGQVSDCRFYSFE